MTPVSNVRSVGPQRVLTSNVKKATSASRARGATFVAAIIAKGPASNAYIRDVYFADTASYSVKSAGFGTARTASVDAS